MDTFIGGISKRIFYGLRTKTKREYTESSKKYSDTFPEREIFNIIISMDNCNIKQLNLYRYQCLHFFHILTKFNAMCAFNL